MTKHQLKLNNARDTIMFSASPRRAEPKPFLKRWKLPPSGVLCFFVAISYYYPATKTNEFLEYATAFDCELQRV